MSVFILASNNIYAQWSELNSGTNQDFWAVSIGNQETIYSAGGPWQFTSSAIISKSEDGGQNWSVQNPVGFVSCIFGLETLGPDTVFAVGCNASVYHGLILRSFDGGINWTTKNISNTWGFYCVEFPTESIGYTCGWNGRIYKTTNSGESWSSLPSGSSQTFRRMCFVDENLGFAACGSDHASTNKIYRTENGNNWTLISNFGSSFIIGGMHFFNADTGIVVGTDGSKAAIKRTTDGGGNWEDVLEGNHSFVLECLDFDGNIGWAAGKYGANNGIFRTEDAGQSWELHFEGLTGTPYSIQKSDTSSYIVGTSGMIMKYNEDIATITGELKIGNTRLYPNPSSNYVKIMLDRNLEINHFKITDLNGKVYAQREFFTEESMRIKTHNWPKGMYLFSAWSNYTNHQIIEKLIIQ